MWPQNEVTTAVSNRDELLKEPAGPMTPPTPQAGEPMSKAEPMSVPAASRSSTAHGGMVPSTGTVQELPETPHDVCTLSRLEPHTFEAILRSGEVRTGDAEFLLTLPQGKAKLETFLIR